MEYIKDIMEDDHQQMMKSFDPVISRWHVVAEESVQRLQFQKKMEDTR